MMPDPLVVWLDGRRTAIVERDRKRIRLTYAPEVLGVFDGGIPLLSWALPLTPEYYPNDKARVFLDGLLPEGEARRVIAEDLGLAAADTFGLIRELGRDCAGAIVVQPVSEGPPPDPTVLTAEPLEDGQLENLVSNLRTAPLGAGGKVRVSLGGVQEKLLVTRLPDGRWGRPVNGTPSTHIIKPEIRGYPDTVENEALCMRIAKNLDLPVAEVGVETLGDRKVIIVSRYDRVIEPSGAVRRIHQEDLCQATGTPPGRKYEEDGGPPLKKLASIVRNVDPDGVETLLRALALNVIIGNGDAHAKNFSLVHPSPGVLRLAPLYDLMCTLAYGDLRLAMYVDEVQGIDRVSLDRVANEGEAWGLDRSRAREVVGELIERFPAALGNACDATHDVPGELLQIVDGRFRDLRIGFSKVVS